MLSEDSPKDVFKFWQSMFIERVCTRGMDDAANTSFEKGKSLGKHYLEQGATNWDDTLAGMIKGMGGVLKIYGEDKEFHATVTYPYRMCYIGGPKSAKTYGVNGQRVLKVNLFQKCLCFPYLQGLLVAYGKNAQVINEECIIEDGLNYCKMHIIFI